MSNEIVIRREDERAVTRAIRYARDWCGEHQWELGVAEMALGASVMAYAVHTGAIDVGREVVGSALSRFNFESLVGTATGSAAGATAAAVLGSIGVTACGTGIGIPVGLLALGGATLFGATGYAVGDAMHNFLAPSFGDLLRGASLLTVGLVLIADGARRVICDKRVLAAASAIKDGVLRLRQLSVEVVARNVNELQAYMQRHRSTVQNACAIGSVTALTAGMASLGGAASAATVTVLGSHALGSAALALGLMSAPMWPVFAGAAVGLGPGYAAWRGMRLAVGPSKDP